jgi:hypothetical protein
MKGIINFKIASYGVLILSICGIYSTLLYPFIIDDAYITFAYSKNFSQTGALVLREGTNVEAISSFLWALILGILSFFSFNPLVWSKFLGFILSSASITVVVFLFARASLNQKFNIYVCLAASLPFSFALWANYGMENGLVSLLCFLAILVLPCEGKKNDFFLIPLVMLCLYCSRPEGFGYVTVLYFAELYRRVIYKKDVASLVLSITALSALVILYESFGYYYYGVLLPDSASAKIGESLAHRFLEGFHYSINGNNLLIDWVIPASFLLLCRDIYNKNLEIEYGRHASLLLGGILSISTIGFVLISGGDWMPATRFYSIVLPFCSGYIAWSLLECSLFNRKWIVSLIFIIVFSLNQALIAFSVFPYIAGIQKSEDRALQKMVDDLNKIATNEDTLALSDIGRAAYGFNGKIFDWWGLASRVIIDRNESLGKIKSKTISDANPEFLVVYTNTKDWPSVNTKPFGMAIHSRALLEDKLLMSRYCRLGSYYFSEYRYHVLLARKDVLNRYKFLSEALKSWPTTDCIIPIKP